MQGHKVGISDKVFLRSKIKVRLLTKLRHMNDERSTDSHSLQTSCKYRVH